MNFNSKAIFYTVVAFYSFQDTVPIFLFFFKKKGGCSCLREVKSISKDIYFTSKQLDDEEFIMKEI